MSSRRCDQCGGEFRFPDKPRKDTHGRYYSAPGEYYIPFQCPHCKGFYCNQHRLPENHNCVAVNHSKKRVKSYSPIGSSDRYASSTYAPKVAQRNLGSYAKAALILSILVIVAYSAANTTLISDLNGFIQSQTPGISSTLTSLGETISKTVNPAPVSISEVEKLIFKYTNDERRKAGLKELVWDDQLALIAREHSEDMAKNDFFSHTNLSGEDPTARAQRHGYPVRKPLGGGSYSLGIAENISKMPTGNVQGHGYINNGADSVAKAVVESWMNSPGHKANILKDGYDKLGVGVGYDGKYYYSTQDFW